MKTSALIISLVLFIAVFALLFSLPVWLLWNLLMPDLFDLKPITWLQALGLNILSGLLFKSQTSSPSSKD